jgi:hypothetical protein
MTGIVLVWMTQRPYGTMVIVEVARARERVAVPRKEGNGILRQLRRDREKCTDCGPCMVVT